MYVYPCSLRSYHLAHAQMPDVLAKCGRGRSREEQAQDDKLVHVKPLVWFLSWGGGGGGVGMYCGTPLFGHLGIRRDCPDYENVLVSGVKDVLWQSMGSHLVRVGCVHIRGVSAIQGSGLAGFYCTPIYL